MPTAVRLLLVEMTRGAGLVGGLLLLAAALVAGVGMVPPEAGPSWSTAFNLALTGQLYAAPLLAGAVTWLIQDHRRRGLGALAATSNRGRVAGALPRVGAACAWAGLAYLVLLVVFAARTAHRGLPSGATLLLALLAGCFLGTCAALGWAIGTLSRVRAAGPLLTVAVFALVCVGAGADGWARPLAPVDAVSTYRPFLQPHVRLIWVQVAVLLAITVLALSALAGRRGSRQLTGLTGAVMLAGAVFTMSRTNPAPTEIRGAPAHPACTQGEPVTVCLRSEDADELAGSARALATASAALAPYLAVPSRFSEPGIDRRIASGPGIYVPPAQRHDPLAFQAAALTAIVPPPCPPRVGDAKAVISYADLLTWAEAVVSGERGVPSYALVRVMPVLAMDQEGQRSWVRHHLAATCAG
jgi:hypothetical protein